MRASLRIAIADDDPEMLHFLKRVLPAQGHRVVVEAQTGPDLVTRCLDERPELVITDIRMPGCDGLQAVHQISLQHPVPAILVSAHDEAEFLERACREHVHAYLVKPIKMVDLEPAIRLATRRFEEFRMLQAEADDLRQALADRTVIERAKGILMDHQSLTEQAAFDHLKQLAAESNVRIAQAAETIVRSGDPCSQ